MFLIECIDVPDKVYDLIVLSEKDYTTYSKEQIYNWILKSASRVIAIIGTQDYMTEFKFGHNMVNIVLGGGVILKLYEFDESLRIYE